MTKQTDKKVIQDNKTILYINTARQSAEMEKKDFTKISFLILHNFFF